MENVKWLIPEQRISKETVKLIEEIGSIIGQSQGVNIVFERLHNNRPAVEQISKRSNVISLVSHYEAMYLETFYEFLPLFKLAPGDIKGYVVVHKNSRTEKLTDLQRQTLIMLNSTDTIFVNPVTLYLLKNTNIIRLDQSQTFAAKLEPLHLYQIVDKKVDVAVATSFEYNLIPEKERKNLRILGEFPIMPEYVVVLGADLKGKNIAKIKPVLERWRSKYGDRYKSLGMEIFAYEGANHSLLLEAIEGLGYTLNKFVEEYNDLLSNSVSISPQKELQEMEEKYTRLKTFNEKLVKMYQDVRDSRDRLTKEIESATDNTILFLKDGTILGASRAFCTLLKYGRQDIVGQEITRFVQPDSNTPFNKLIQQIDVGLVRSFAIKLKKSDGTESLGKMEFSIIELMDSKVILGILSDSRKN